MKLTHNHLLVGGIILAVILIACVVVIFRIGKAYQSGIDNFSAGDTPSDVTHIERDKITKLTLTHGNDKGCMEVTPDGAVRVYDTCGGELTDANRISDSTNITRLFKQVSELNLSGVKPAGQTGTCDTYIISITTASNVTDFCLSDIIQSDTNGGGGQYNTDVGEQIISDITQTIDTIIEQIPEPTPTALPALTETPPFPTSTLSPSISPTETLPPYITPSVTPEAPSDGTFTCDFSQSGSKVPYRVSNVVCTSLPQATQ